MAYAIFTTGGKQYKVSPGDTIDVEKFDDEAAAGSSATFDRVLLHADGESVTTGTPFIEGAKVTGEVVDAVRAPKVTAFKYRRRKGYHRKVGHRQQLTRVRIENIAL